MNGDGVYRLRTGALAALCGPPLVTLSAVRPGFAPRIRPWRRCRRGFAIAERGRRTAAGRRAGAGPPVGPGWAGRWNRRAARSVPPGRATRGRRRGAGPGRGRHRGRRTGRWGAST